MNRKEPIKFEIEVRGDLNFSYGQKLFCLRTDGGKNFSEPCPICDDSRKVEIRGVEFDCPACGRNSSFSQKITNSIYLNDYKIVEYIINEITIKGPESKSSFAEKCKDYYDLPVVWFSMFARSGSSYNSICTRRVPSSEIDKNPNHERIVSARGIDDFVFTEKKFATEAVKVLKKRDAELLKKFNAEHGTSHKYPFEI